MGQYLIDNNAISNYFSEVFSDKGMNFIADVFDSVPTISVITEIEALSWVHPDISKEKIIHQFIKDSNILSLNSTIVAECIRIRRSKKIKTPDAIIAATALVHHLTLITSDIDFNHIKGLKVIDPKKL